MTESTFNENQPPTEMAPTLQAGAFAPRAWSDPIAVVADYKPPRDWRGKLINACKYLAPAAIVAVVLTLTLGGHRPAPTSPTPAPPTAATVTWTPDHSKDDGYIQALVNGGYEVGGINTKKADANNRQQSLEVAYWTCTNLSQGNSIEQVVKHWDEDPDPSISAKENHDDDAQWVNIIVSNLCPQFRNQHS